MTKINQLVKDWPKGTIKTAKELAELGYTPQLLKIYVNSKWLGLYGRGIYKLFGDEVAWEGVLYGLQKKKETTIHAGAKTALGLKGYRHYLAFGEEKIFLFSDKTENFNSWLKMIGNAILKRTELFDYQKKEYFTDFNVGNYKIKISVPELAIMETLYLIPKEQSFDEALKLMEGLTTLRGNLVQKLLDDCNSVKVKRLFLFMAEKSDHSWFKELNVEKINLGSGKRVIVKNGVLDKKYLITVPREYVG